MTDRTSNSRVVVSRNRLMLGAVPLSLSTLAFGFVYGVAARDVGLSLTEAVAMSSLVLAGAAQFAAVGLIGQAVAWPAIVILVALINARNLMYAASLAPLMVGRGWLERAASAHFVDDEVFALSSLHARRLEEWDQGGFWMAAGSISLPWVVGTLVGHLVGQSVADPRAFGLDVVFPAAMGGLAVGLIRGRRDVVATIAGAGAAIVVVLLGGATFAVVAGGLGGALLGAALPERRSGEEA